MIDNKSKKRLLAVTVVLLVAIAYMIYSSSVSSYSYFKKISEINADSSFVGKNVRVGGRVQPGSIVQKGRTFSFVITENQHKLSVEYSGQVPSTFGNNVQAIIEGKLVKKDKIIAKSVVTQCPSKYKSKKIEDTK